MPGRLLQWPEWPEFTSAEGEKNDDLVQYKKDIISQFGEASLRTSWLQVCKALETVTADLAEKGTSSIHEIEYDDFSTLSSKRKEELKDIGCFVVRNVIPEEQVTAWFHDLKSYVAANRSNITGWPAETPFVMNLYFSPTQIAVRSHPRQLRIARELNSLWHDATAPPGNTNSSTSPPAFTSPLTYADAVRIRPPGIPLRGLGPHIDAGSLSRWVDPSYRSVYAAVFSGHPETLDLYDMSKRKDAQQACFTGAGHSRVLRAFQGWTALTSAGPGEGSLMLYPAVKWAIAYVMLRPFFTPPDDAAQMMDAEKWKFDANSPWFPGTFRENSQLLSPSSHPHLRLQECMVSIPRMNPGDTIWWHADMCHAVEVEHNGSGDASVVYIAATPSTEQNLSYIKGQLRDFLAGNQPEDFRSPKRKLNNERLFFGYQGEKSILSQQGRRAMGFEN